MDSDSPFSPIAILQYTLSYVSPYLPTPVAYALHLSLRVLSSLPPWLANVLPLLLAGFAAYTALLSTLSTARYAVRTTWWLLKWSAFAGVIAWAFGVKPDYNPANITTRGLSGAYNRWQNGYYGGSHSARNAGGGTGGMADYLAQAANVAGFGQDNNDQAGFLGSFLQNPVQSLLRQVIQFPASQDATSSSSKKKSTKSRRRQGEAEMDVEEIQDTASKWIAGLAGKAWEAVNAPNTGDRWTESRNRRQGQKNR